VEQAEDEQAEDLGEAEAEDVEKAEDEQ